jgi:hypothetical protein
MSRAPLDSDPGELLRQLAQESLPSSPEDSAPARRDRLVRAMKDAVDRSAEANEKSRRLRLAGAVVAAAAAFALLGGMWWKEHARAVTSIAGLDRVSGTVVLTQDGKGRVVSGGERALHDGDALQTATGAHAHFQTSKSSVNVSESTELRLSRPSAAEERISLRRGRVDVSVEKAIETKRAVVVETPDAEVVVRGTIFDVRVDPLQNSTNTRVHVTRGSVWVLAQGVQVALLSAGQSWSSASGVESAARPTADVPTATPAPVTTEAPLADAPAPAPVKAGTARDPAARKSGTLAEENRLFSAGVEARNRGDAQRAAELFGELLSTYPQTTLREVAQVERFRALSRAGQSARAASEARHYLAEHPDGAAKTEARDLALDTQK